MSKYTAFRGLYINAKERNVHIWSSLIDNPEYSTDNKSTPDDQPITEDFSHIVAGCYTRGQLRVDEIFYWLDEIMEKNKDNLSMEFAFFPLNIDPTDCSAQQYFEYLAEQRVVKNKCLFDQSSEFIENGHYALFMGNRKKGGGLKVFIPQLDEITIESRTPRARKATVWRAGARKPRERAIPRNKFHHKAPLSEGVKNSKTKEPPSNKGQHKTYTRSKKLPMDVRSRDMRCRVTGLDIPHRDLPRGPNFTGHQVAHIYPLGYVDQAPENVRDKTTLALIETHEAADKPHNALLMRADIHDLFDDYQFGYMPAHRKDKGSQKYKLVIFERSGAPMLVEKLGSDLFGPGGDSNIPDIDDKLIRFHFRTCLLCHFAGGGRMNDSKRT